MFFQLNEIKFKINYCIFQYLKTVTREIRDSACQMCFATLSVLEIKGKNKEKNYGMALPFNIFLICLCLCAFMDDLLLQFH